MCHECGGPEPKTVPPPPPGVSHVICPGTNHKIPEISSKRLPSAITCDLCKKQFHQMCTGLGRDVIKAILDGSATAWICKSCNNPVNPNFAKPAVPINEISESQPAQTRDSIKIMQWNADGLKSKTVELEDRLNAENIDVCAIQETKMKKDDLSPTIKGYRPAGRNDRIEKKFGGVMFYVKDSLNFDPGQKSAHAGTESSTIRVKLSRAKWINISTVYTPPANSNNKAVFAPQHIPVNDNSLILGDLNGHDELWDALQPPDARGEDVAKWIFDNNLAVVNDRNKATRINKQTGGLSSPDVSLAGSNWSNKCIWSTGDQIGKSDHLPITIAITTTVQHQTVFGRKARWRRNGINWNAFREEIEDETSNLPSEPNITQRVIRLNSIIIEAAHNHVGKTKPGKSTRPHITPTVRAALRKRNRLRRKLNTNRKEWLEACREAHEEIEKSKEEAWRDLLSDTATNADSQKMWGLIKSLNGSPDTNAPNQAMRHNGRTITSSQKKADIFSMHYASVSKLNFNKADRDLNRKCKDRLKNSASADDESCSDFTMVELTRAIRKMRRKGAEGPDDIPPTFLKELGHKALTELLSIFNISFRKAECPQIWRNAIILPLLKSGKLASELPSYRPISLTSCVVKLLERMINDRLYHLAETRGMFNHQQAGFRKGRGCEDQAARIIQAIEDGFQHKPMLRSVLVLLDFSKAYDTVWQQKLLLSMIDQGVPMTLIRWINCFLQNRQAKVRFNNVLSRSRKMRQGLPQGSVLSPILFLFYINNLAKILPSENINSLFADDVTILAVRKSLEEAEAAAQTSVDTVVRWADEWKLKLNATKSEACFFTSSPKEAKWTPNIVVPVKSKKKKRKVAIPFKPTPRLLGVILDRQLCFGPHIDSISEKLQNNYRMLAAVSHSKWGWKKDMLRSLYIGLINSSINYAGFAWQSSISDTQIKALERLSNRALRICTGHMKKTPVEALYLEMRLPNIRTQIKRSATTAAEKCLRSNSDHPRRIAFENAATPRTKALKRTNWAIEAKKNISNLGLDDDPRKPLTHFNHPPWLDSANVTVNDTLPGITSKNAPEATIIEAAVKQIRSLNPTITIYTDGSASAGTTNGGAGVVYTTGDPTAPDITSKSTKKGSKHTSSFGEELTAMEEASDYILQNCNVNDVVVIATDSQSLCSSLSHHSPASDTIRAKLAKSEATIIVQWIPGHSNIPGNEAADAAAKEAALLPGPHLPTTFRSASSLVKSSFFNGPGRYPKIDEAYSQLNSKKEKMIPCRSYQVELARLRSGYSMYLRDTQHQLDESIDPKCPRCGAANETVEHWLECPGTAEARHRIFGPEANLGLPLLTKHPLQAVTLAQKTLVGCLATESQ